MPAHRMLPFPPTLAAISAACSRRLSSSDVDDAGTRRPHRPHDYVAANTGGYIWPDGRVSPSYSPYKPDYPEGTDPALLRVKYKLEYFPNGDHSYNRQVLETKTASDMEKEGLHVDYTTAAILMKDKKAALVVADNEEEIAALLKDVEADIRRPVIVISENEADRLEHFFFMVSQGGGNEVFASSSEEGLHEILVNRFSHHPETQDLGEMIEVLGKAGLKNSHPCGYVERSTANDLAADYLDVEQSSDERPSP